MYRNPGHRRYALLIVRQGLLALVGVSAAESGACYSRRRLFNGRQFRHRLLRGRLFRNSFPDTAPFERAQHEQCPGGDQHPLTKILAAKRPGTVELRR